MASHLKGIRGSWGDELEGKRIALCVTGSVSAYKAVDIARLLMRHGADVFPVITPSAKKLVTPELLTWATGNATITELTGFIEHVELGSKTSENAVQLVLVAPCTANTISKIASGVDDTPVTSLVSVALGSGIPVLIAPAMHEPMYHNPFVKRNIEALQKEGVGFVFPKLEEGKAKLASPEEVLYAVISKIGKKKMEGLNVLVTAGPTREFLDPIRIFTNPSSGKMGYAFAQKAKLWGASVTLVTGPTQIAPPYVDKLLRVTTTSDLLRVVESELKQKKYHVVIFAAAPSDYRPVQSEAKKISSSENPEITVKLVANPKVVASVKKLSPDAILVGFKAEHAVTKEELLNSAKRLIKETHADFVVANDSSLEGAAFEWDTNQGILVSKEEKNCGNTKTTKGEVCRNRARARA